MRRRVNLCLPLAALVAALALLFSSALAAYTIRLKNGSEIIAKKKYVVQGDKAIIVLPSGVESVLAFSEIDVAETEAANLNNLGTAMVIENGKAVDLALSAPPPPKKETLQDLLGKRAAAEGTPNAGAVAMDAGPTQRSVSRPLPTSSERAPLRNVELSTAIRTFIFGRGISNLVVQQGPRANQPRLVFETASETQVFRALIASAGALLEMRDKRPGEVEAFEVICDGPAGGRAGRFTLTSAQAADLLAGKITLPAFFFQNVEF